MQGRGNSNGHLETDSFECGRHFGNMGGYLRIVIGQLVGWIGREMNGSILT
jgi:hypothetical protein